MKLKKLVSALGVVGLYTALSTTQAQQATPPAKIEKIEITGSNIKRVDSEGPAPVQVITREDIERSGASVVAEVLRNLPLNTAASFDETFVGSFARGSAGVSLRALGQKSTLVLINGRRTALYPFAQNLNQTFVDLNSIPLSAIERIDVLKDGASAVYGSDAIAGVINIILRRDYKGLEAKLGGGITAHHDGTEKQFNFTGGMGDYSRNRYNVLLAFDYFDRGHVWARDRENTRTSDYRRFPGGQNIPNSTVGNPGTYERRTGTNPFPTQRQAFANCPPERIFVLPAVTGTNCSLDTNQFESAIPETERIGGYSRLAYSFNDQLAAFLEVGFNRTESFTQTSPFAAPSSQVGPGIARQVMITLPMGHPNNPFNSSVDVRYRFADVGPRQLFVTTDAERYVGGLKGLFGNWEWEAGALLAKSKTVQDERNAIFIPGLMAVIADRSYDFVDNSRNTQQVYDRLRININRTGETELQQFDLKASRDVWQLPSGSVAMAVGLEHRREEVNDTSDDALLRGDVLGRGSTTARGSRNSTSGFIEFSVPVMKTLELQLAGRTDRYSDYGNSTTPKIAMRWQPNKQVLMRASYAQGFRAPSLPEIAESSSFSFVTLRDARRCAINDAYCATVSLPVTTAANPNLKAETSDSYTLGLVYEPVREFSIGIDYYNITTDDVIATRSNQTILNNENTNPELVVRGQPSAIDISRGAPGPIVLVRNRYENLQQTRTSGIDVDLQLRVKAGALGTFFATSNSSYLLSFKTENTPGQGLVEFAGTYNLPRFRSTSTIGVDKQPWSASLTMNYVHQYRQSTAADLNAEPNIKAWTTLDAQVAYSGIKKARLTFGIRNLQDKSPPIAISEPLLASRQQHNPRGRFYYANVSYKFW